MSLKELSNRSCMKAYDSMNDDQKEEFLLGFLMAIRDCADGDLPMISQDDHYSYAFMAGYDAYWNREE